MSLFPAVSRAVRVPFRTKRMAPGAPAATSASRSFWSPVAWVSVVIVDCAGADAATSAGGCETREDGCGNRQSSAQAS